MWSAVLWILLALVGGIIFEEIVRKINGEKDFERGFSIGGFVIGILIVAFLKFNFTDKVFICKEAILNSNLPANVYLRDHLVEGAEGSKMILELTKEKAICTFFDKEEYGGREFSVEFVKCNSYYNKDLFLFYYTDIYKDRYTVEYPN